MATLCFKVAVDFPEAIECSDFQLQVLVPGLSSPAEYARFDSRKDRHCKFYLPSTLLPRDAVLLLRVYHVRLNDSRLECQYKYGYATANLQKLISNDKTETRVVNVSNQQVATMRIYHIDVEGELAFNSELKAPTWTPIYQRQEHPTEDVRGLGLLPCSPLAASFRRLHVPYAGLKCPVWQFEIMPMKFEACPGFWTRAIRSALQLMRVDEKEFIKNPFHSLQSVEVLAQVLGYSFSWMSPYLFDQFYDIASGQFVGFDDFSVVHDKPDPARYSSDCEDASKTFQSMFQYIVDELKTSDPLLLALQRLARHYMAATIDASISTGAPTQSNPYRDKEGDPISLHNYVVLFPVGRVMELFCATGDKKLSRSIWAEVKTRRELTDADIVRSYSLPTLHLESTDMTMASAELDDDPICVHSDAFMRKYHAAKNTMFYGLEHQEDICELIPGSFRLCCSQRRYEQDSFYRLGLVAYFPDLYAWFGIPFVLMTNRQVYADKWSYGVDIMRMVRYLQRSRLNKRRSIRNSPFGFKASTPATAAERKSVSELTRLQSQPLCDPMMQPAAFAQPLPPVPKGYYLRLHVREIDWSDKRKRAMAAMLKGLRYIYVAETRTMLAGFNVVILHCKSL